MRFAWRRPGPQFISLETRVLGLGDQRRKPHRTVATKKLISLCNSHFVQRQLCNVAVFLSTHFAKLATDPFFGMVVPLGGVLVGVFFLPTWIVT